MRSETSRAASRVGAGGVAAAAAFWLAGSLAPAPARAGGRVEVGGVSKHLFRAMQAATRRARETFGADEADMWRRGSLADNRVAPGERALLAALRAGDYEVLVVRAEESPTFSPTPLEVRRKVDPSALAVLDALLAHSPPAPEDYDDPYEALARGDAAGLKALLDRSRESPAQRQRVVAVYRKLAREAFEASSHRDGYRRFEGFVGRLYGLVSDLEGGDWTAARQLLFDAIEREDRGEKTTTTGGIPDHLYRRLEPGDAKRRAEARARQDRANLEAYRKAKAAQRARIEAQGR